MWPIHLSRPRASTSEQSRPKKGNEEQKGLQEEQQNNCLHGTEKFRIKKKNEKGGNPKTNTTGACNSREGAARDHVDPETCLPSGTVGAAWVKSVTDLEIRYQCLLLALDWSRLRHKHLFSEIHQLKQEKKDLQEQQQEENEKMAQEQEMLKAELEDHKVAIQRLVSEEGRLQSALAHMEKEANKSQAEHEDLTSRLQASQQHSLDLELALSALTTTHEDTEQKNRQLIQGLGDVKLQLEAKSRSCDNLQELNAALQGKLDMLCTQQSDMKLRREKFQQALEERAVLKGRVEYMKNVVSALRVERSTWTEKVRWLSQEMDQLTEEWEEDLWQMVDLEKKLAEMEKQLAEAQCPAGPSQDDQQHQAQVCQMQEDFKNLQQQLKIQIQENQRLNLQNLEQQERLLILEKKVEEWDQLDESQPNILDTQRCTDGQMRELKEQLEQLQGAVHRLSTEKDQLTSLLTSEQQEKKQLQEKLEQREMELGEWKEVAERRSQAAHNLQELNAQYLTQLQELGATREDNMASTQPLSAENEELQQHLLRHTQLLEQQEQDQSLQDTSQCLEARKEEKEHLQAQLSFLALPREGKEGDKEEARAEEATPAAMTIPEAVDNPRVMQAFYIKAKSVAEVRKIKLSQQLQEQEARCQCLANLAAQCQARLEQQALFPKSRNHGPSGDRKQDTRVSKKKAKICFMQAPPDKVEHQSPVEDLQHQCSQLSKHIIALDDSIMVYKVGIEVLDKLHKEKDDCVKQLTQEKEQKKKELQELLVLLLGEGMECLGQMPALPETPAAEATSHLPGPSTTEESEEQKIFEDAQLQESVQPAQGEENDELAIMTLKTCQPSWHMKKM
ncbi:golgin subfamily A member 2-like [Thomomys bottae]